MHPTADPSEEALRELRDAVLSLHRGLIDCSRREHERAHGRVAGPADLLRLLTENASFAWLRRISGWVVGLDEALEQHDRRAIDLALEALDRSIHGALGDADDFTQKYRAALQREPEVVMLHARVANALKRLRPERRAAAEPTEFARAPRVEAHVARIVRARDDHVDDALSSSRVVFDSNQWPRFQPFVRLSDDGLRVGAVREHAFAGLDTFTLVLAGAVEHLNSREGQGLLRAGDAQWLSAGSGILHREVARGADDARVLQLWLESPAELAGAMPRYAELRASAAPVESRRGVSVRVVAGRASETRAPAVGNLSLDFFEVHAVAGAHFSHEIDGGTRALIYLVSGSARFGPERSAASEGECVEFAPQSDAALGLVAQTDVRAVLVAARPSGRPASIDGSLAAASAEELARLRDDLRFGRFRA